VLLYRDLAKAPAIIDEDRYELYLSPKHPRYFFRRLMWANLFSGGMATYGGLKTYEAYDGELRGVQGYYDAVESGKLIGGAADFNHIHKFFKDTGLTLAGMQPQDALTGYNPDQVKCIRDENHILVYLQNADSYDAETANVEMDKASVKLHLPRHVYNIEWYNPRDGKWMIDEELPKIGGGYERELTCPFPGDAVLVLTRE